MATASPTGPVSAAPAPDPFDILDFGSPSSSGPAISSSTQPNESRTAKEVSLFDKNGFTARISRVGAVDGGTEYRISYYNAIPVPMENLVFQAAVPKVGIFWICCFGAGINFAPILVTFA